MDGGLISTHKTSIWYQQGKKRSGLLKKEKKNRKGISYISDISTDLGGKNRKQKKNERVSALSLFLG